MLFFNLIIKMYSKTIAILLDLLKKEKPQIENNVTFIKTITTTTNSKLKQMITIYLIDFKYQ